MDAVLWTAARHSFVLPEEHRVPEIKGPLRWEFARTCTRLAERLAAALGMLTETDLTLRSAARAPEMALMERTLVRLAMMPRSRG